MPYLSPLVVTLLIMLAFYGMFVWMYWNSLQFPDVEEDIDVTPLTDTLHREFEGLRESNEELRQAIHEEFAKISASLVERM